MLSVSYSAGVALAWSRVAKAWGAKVLQNVIFDVLLLPIFHNVTTINKLLSLHLFAPVCQSPYFSCLGFL